MHTAWSECVLDAEAPAPAGSGEERDALVLRHLPQVRLVAREMAARMPQHVEVADLVSAGVVGLLQAVDRFNPQRDASLATYAHYRIRGAILDSLRTQDWAPRRLRRIAKQMEEARRTLLMAFGRTPTDVEIADQLGLSLPTFHEQRRLVSTLAIVNFNAALPTDSEGDANAISLDRIPSREPSPLQMTLARERKALLARAIAGLPPRERQAITLYYLEEMTMKQAGAVMGITESRVSQLHALALASLQRRMLGSRTSTARKVCRTIAELENAGTAERARSKTV